MKYDDRVKTLDAQRILLLLQREENTKLDFKLKPYTETESSKKELAKDICAIANSRGGRGYILFGIEDKTKNIIGIDRNEFHEEKIQQIVSTRIDPPVPISVDIINLENRDIGVITIYTTEQKPHQLRDNGAFYIRRGSTTDIMRKEEIASMLEETGLLVHELLPVVKGTINDLDEKKIIDYFIKTGMPDEINKSVLYGSGIISRDRDSGEYHPTIGGMLLFGRNPEVFLPHCIIRIHNSLNPRYPYHHISRGTVMEMLDDACNFLRRCLEGYDLPIEIIQELLGKSVIYRDYFDVNNCIEVYLNNKNIEITNPGAANKGGESDKDKYIKRNMWLYLKVLSIDSSKKYFHKNININQLMKGRGRIKYFNILTKNVFKVIIPLQTTIYEGSK